jgi:hypothetical protein
MRRPLLPALVFPAFSTEARTVTLSELRDTLAARDCGQGRTTRAEAAGVNPRRAVEVLLNTHGRPADVEWTRAEWTGICEHLHNQNNDFRFVMGFEKYGCKQYVRSKNVKVSQAIKWAWDSIGGKAKTRMAFVPYSMNNRKQSRWGALDFDAHDGEHERARSFAFAAFQELMTSDLFVILEMSGAGWHVWAVSQDFQPVGRWVKLLKAVAQSIGAPIRDGVCEIFPPDTLPENSEFGLGMRAPGSWNPGTETVNLIFWQNLKVCDFAKDSKSHFTDKRKKLLSIGAVAEGTKGWYRGWKNRWEKRFGITSPCTRNKKLCGLAGELFYQVGHDMARRIVEEQFRSKTVETVATLPEHLESFSHLWLGLQADWLARLTAAERLCLDGLETEHLKDAFRIVWSYARKAADSTEADFCIAAADLGERLGITLPGACAVRKALVRSGAIEQTAPFQPNRRAARYRWCVNVPDRSDRWRVLKAEQAPGGWRVKAVRLPRDAQP